MNRLIACSRDGDGASVRACMRSRRCKRHACAWRQRARSVRPPALSGRAQWQANGAAVRVVVACAWIGMSCGMANSYSAEFSRDR